LIPTLLIAAIRMKSAALEEARERRWNGMPRAAEPYRRANHYLFGDEVLRSARKPSRTDR
jgi:hypothetical protein